MSRAPLDAVTCPEVLEHLTRPAAELREIHRVLRPGGPLVVTVPNVWGPYEMANRILEWWDVRGTVKALVINRQERERRQRQSTFNPHTPHEQHFTRGRLNRLLESAGFRVERVGHSDFMSWVPYLRNIRAVAQFDCAVADHLPSILVSGWAIHARRP